MVVSDSPVEDQDKKCGICSQVKPLDLFVKGRNRCRDCNISYFRQYKKDKAAGIDRVRISLDKRICKVCNQLKDISLFRKRRATCKECYKKAVAAYNQKKKLEFISVGPPKDKDRECRTCKERKLLSNFQLTGYQCFSCKENKPDRLALKRAAKKQKYIDSCGELKTCLECNQEKRLSEFRMWRNSCKSCNRQKLKAKRLQSKSAEKILESFGINKTGERERIKTCIRCSNSKFESEFVTRNKSSKKNYCKACQNERNRHRYAEKQNQKGLSVDGRFGKEKFTKAEALYRAREAVKEKRRANPEIQRARCRKYKKENRHKFNAYHKKRYYTDLSYNAEYKARGRIRRAIKAAGFKKTCKTKELLGCDFSTLKSHLISNLKDGMTWEKILTSEIEIDHVIPCSLYDMSDIEEQKRCFNYKNLIPLWANDNYTKGDLYMGIRWKTVPKSIKKISSLTQMTEELFNLE